MDTEVLGFGVDRRERVGQGGASDFGSTLSVHLVGGWVSWLASLEIHRVARSSVVCREED